MTVGKLTSSAAAGAYSPFFPDPQVCQADESPLPLETASKAFLELARLADSNADPAQRRRAEFFDGCHWLAVGNIDEAAVRFQRVRGFVPEADAILKKLEADRLHFANLAALEAWDLYNREAETMQKDVDQGYLARIFSNSRSLDQAREKRFGPERKLIRELKRRIDSGEAETLLSGLRQIQEKGPEELQELSKFLLSKDAKTYVGDPRPALIEFASSTNPEKSQIEFLLQRTAELEHQSDMPSTCYAVNALVRGFSLDATASADRDMERLSSSGQFAATLAKLALSASAEGVAGDVALMFASAGLGNLAKLSALTKLEKLGVTGYQALAVAGVSGIGVESTAFWAGNTAKDSAFHDPEKVLQAEQLARRYGATLLTIGGLKVFGQLGESLASGVSKAPGLAEQALAQGIKHGAGLGGLTATNQLNQALGWQQRPEGGFAESFAGDLFSYVEFAAAHKMADRATGQALSKIQEKQQKAIAVQERKVLSRPQPASTRPTLLHPIFAPLWAFLGAGGVGGGGWTKPDGRRFLESIQAEIDQIPHGEDWHHKIEQSGEIAAGSHRGIGYDEHNEDRYFFGEKSDGKTLLVAIDGLGGHLDGEQASAIVRRTFESGTLVGLSVPETLGLAHQTIEAYTLKKHPPSWRTSRRGRYDPGSVAAAVEIERGPDGEFQGRFWNVGDAEAVVLRLSPEDGSVQVVHHTLRPPTDAFERKQNGEPFATTADGRLDLADVFDHRIIDSPVESFLGDKSPVIHYQRRALKAGDIVLVGSDGFFENFRSFDLIGKIIAESGAKTSAQVHEALFQESLIRMALLDIANNQELTHEVYVEAYRHALNKEPPPGWKGMYEPTADVDGTRKSYLVYYRGILNMDTGQVVDTLKQDNLTLLVQVLGEQSDGR